MLTIPKVLSSGQWWFTFWWAYGSFGLLSWMYCYLSAPNQRARSYSDRAFIIVMFLVAWWVWLLVGVRAEVMPPDDDDEDDPDEPKFV